MLYSFHIFKNMQEIDIDFMKNSYEDKDVVLGYLHKNDVFSESESNILLKYLNIDDSILDYWCGTWRVLNWLSKLWFNNLSWIDISYHMIQSAKNELKNIRFIHWDVIEHDFKWEKFDKILAIHSITPIPWKENRKEALNKLKEILKPGWILIMSTFLRQYRRDWFWEEQELIWSVWKQDARYKDFWDVIFQHWDTEIFVHIPSIEEIDDMVRQSWFEIIEKIHWYKLIKEKDEASIESAQRCHYWILKA